MAAERRIDGRRERLQLPPSSLAEGSLSFVCQPAAGPSVDMKSAALVLLSVAAASRLVGVQANGGGDALGNDFDRQAALDRYSALSRELLRSAMIAAGFEGEDLEPDSDAYLDFASLALSGEKRRLVGIRDALREKLGVSGDGGGRGRAVPTIPRAATRRAGSPWRRRKRESLSTS